MGEFKDLILPVKYKNVVVTGHQDVLTKHINFVNVKVVVAKDIFVPEEK